MKIADVLLKKLNRKFEADATVPFRFRNNDVVVRTNGEGDAVQAFIGKMNERGLIRGDRYARSIIRDREGKIIKDYWERKGKAS